MAGQFAVIGLGIFGRTVALSLARAGQQVLAIDADQTAVDSVSAELDAVARADATDVGALHELRLERMTCVVVAIGAQATEASILATALLREMGVPRIVARSLSELHGRVLRSVGADEVVSPEGEMGARLARRLAEPNILERLALSENAELVEIEVPETFVGKTLVELNVRQRYGVSVVAIRRAEHLLATVEAGEVLEAEDVLVVIGGGKAISRLAALA